MQEELLFLRRFSFLSHRTVDAVEAWLYTTKSAV